MEKEVPTDVIQVITDQLNTIRNQLHNDFVEWEHKMNEKWKKQGQNGHTQQHPSRFTHMPSDFYDFPQDMPLEETSKQGGARTTFSLFGQDKNPPQDQHTWQRFLKLDMHQFEGSDPMGWVFQMEQYFKLHNITNPVLKVKIGVLYLDVERFRWW